MTSSKLKLTLLAEVPEEDLGDSEGAGLLTQLLGPNRHTAQEQHKAGASWKTRQREGFCPGEPNSQQMCIAGSTGDFSSQSIQDSISFQAGIILTLWLYVLGRNGRNLAQQVYATGNPLMHVALPQHRSAGLLGCGTCAAQQQLTCLPAAACHRRQAHPQGPSAAAGCWTGRHAEASAT